MDKYLALCKKNRNYKILVIVLIISQFGSWFSQAGIFTLLTKINAPVWAISLSAAMSFIPSIILSPFSGSIIEVTKKINLLKICLFIEMVCIFLLLFINSMSNFWFLQILIFIRMGSAMMYFQTEMSLLPKLLNKIDLKIANELHAILWSACYTLGMASAGMLIYLCGIKISFLIDFILFMIGNILIQKISFKEEILVKNQKVFLLIKEGLIYLFTKKEIFHRVMLHGLIGATSYDALITLLAKYNYKEVISASLAIGLMNSTRAIGLSVGPMLLTKFINKKGIFYLFIAQFLGISLWALLEFNFYLALIGLFFTGLFTTTLWSYTFSDIQLNCNPSFHGRIIAWIDTIFLGISTIVSFLIGKLFNLGLNLSTITFLIGIVMFIGAYYYKFIQTNYESKI